MKMIVNVPDDTYEYIKNVHVSLRVNDLNRLATAIYEGVPVEDSDLINKSVIGNITNEVCKINPFKVSGSIIKYGRHKNCDDIKLEVLEIINKSIGD